MGRRCRRLRRAAAVGSVRRPSPGSTAMGATRRQRPFRLGIWSHLRSVGILAERRRVCRHRLRRREKRCGTVLEHLMRWPRARADPAASGRLVDPSSHSPLILLEDDEDRSAPLIALRSACSASSVRRGMSIIVNCAARGSVIQAGNSARVPSSCSMTKWTLPPWCNRRTTTTRSPARGC